MRLQNRTLFFGDNLQVIEDRIPDESFDLIYLDPPFNSNRNYNVLFKEGTVDSTAQIRAFEDTWEWIPATIRLFEELKENPNPQVAILVSSFYEIVRPTPMMAYLVNMTARLIPLHRVLKDTGSIYLHCDPTASHYLKIIMDVVFGRQNYRNEIVWCYETAGKSKRHFSKKHDVLLFYTKSDKWLFNAADVSIPRKPGKHMKMGVDVDGREYEEKVDKKSGKVYRWHLDEGRLPFDYWTDIQFINREESQRMGYPTQKPEALLERMIKASSNPDDWVLDPFCGCGTTVAVSEKLGRNWIGIDISM